ncbi:DedA family protein [Inconstantimicrobium mannanitabidum]|uniref:Uncharacterized protein n=1 Tax=Inconstantimicrobium mannanitabidum TaxID=1604901 RepID=A0ACB5RCI2_9CLOT|nr:DedA family protein [Clostridium sp. TW13]GKX66512.1 hypothetical protein rsdtw13_17700 [Clostridium sp. TW13]
MTQVLMEYFKEYNIWFLGILLLVQSTGIPTGGTLLVIASGAFSYAGEFNIFILFIEVWILISFGDWGSYMIWKFIGHRVLNKFPKVKRYMEPKILKSHKYLEQHGRGAVFLTRFLISPMGPFVNAAAGIADYKMSYFILFAILGEFLWSFIYLGLGYWFGDSWESIVPIITQVSEILAGLIILGIIIHLFIKTLKKK